MQQAVRSLVQLERTALLSGFSKAGAAGFSTKSFNDYSLAMKEAAEVGTHMKGVPGEVGVCAGVPMETFTRKARIYSPARTASQSGNARTTTHPSSVAPGWKIVFDNTGKWVNPLMGWTSTADSLENVGRASLFFFTKEQAADFCKKHGWEYVIEEPNLKRTDRQKCRVDYASNFSVKKKGIPIMSHQPSIRLGKGTPQ